jgi:long-chain acyl-CoA synthetase
VLTVGDCIEHASQRFPERVAHQCGDEQMTYAELFDRCSRLGTALRALGLVPGDRVAILAANCHRYLEVFVAIPAVDLVVVPLNTRLAPPELADIVNDCQPRVLITDRTIDALGELAAKFERVVCWPEDYETVVAKTTPLGWHRLSNAVTTERLAALFYTGGTTGRSKGVMLSHENLVTNSFHKTIGVGLTSTEVFLAAPAMFHVAGIAPLLSLLGLGARIVFVPGFDAALCLDIIERESVTMMFPVPTMLASMVAEQRRKPRSVRALRMLGHAASPMSAASIEAAAATFPGVELAQFYGATETTSIVTCQHHEEAPENAEFTGSCGQPVVGMSVRVIDDTGADMPIGEPGEVIVSGRSVMVGYWHRPEETATVLRNEWYHTGDIGCLDETRHLFIVDRAKDMIVTGAENVYCIEVENVLYAQPGVLEVAVFGIPHETWGEAVHAVVVVDATADGRPPHGEAVRLSAACRMMLAGYKVPKSFDIQVTPLPKSGPGKVLKRALREPFWADQPSRVR